ncbi:MAG: elongation factor 1-beta [Conexivisphaerales archaeon]|jgi:elongation factor 1-beta
MADLVARIKVLPEDIESKPEQTLEDIKASTKAVASVIRYRVEPIAFGLNALIIDFGIEDKEGGTDPLEMALLATKGISQVDVMGVSKSSTHMR